jgi:hypothetical protein
VQRKRHHATRRAEDAPTVGIEALGYGHATTTRCAPRTPKRTSGYNVATRWRSNPDVPQNIRDSQDRSQGYHREDGEGNLYRRGNGYRISVTMTDPEVIE